VYHTLHPEKTEVSALALQRCMYVHVHSAAHTHTHTHTHTHMHAVDPLWSPSALALSTLYPLTAAASK
jgi:hypothetical protein